VVTIKQLAGVTAQHNEIVKRVANGSLDYDMVRSALQAIIEKRELPVLLGVMVLHSYLPSWYV
jgi:hypothetical protein